jgi:hypothetical protein
MAVMKQFFPSPVVLFFLVAAATPAAGQSIAIMGGCAVPGKVENVLSRPDRNRLAPEQRSACETYFKEKKWRIADSFEVDRNVARDGWDIGLSNLEIGEQLLTFGKKLNTDYLIFTQVIDASRSDYAKPTTATGGMATIGKEKMSLTVAVYMVDVKQRRLVIYGKSERKGAVRGNEDQLIQKALTSSVKATLDKHWKNL